MAIRALADLALIWGFLAGAPVAAAPLCRIEGWSRDPDRSGLRVRVGPSVQARVLGRLAPVRQDEDGRRYGPTFRIIEARKGWLRIADARVERGPALRTMPHAGWVSGGFVGLAVQSTRGFAAPDTRARPVIGGGSDWLSPSYDVIAVLDCSGEWAKVAFRVGSVTRPAWVRRTCANQWTTCDIPE